MSTNVGGQNSAQEKPGNKKTNKILLIVAAVIVAFIVLIAIAGFVFFRVVNRHFRAKRDPQQSPPVSSLIEDYDFKSVETLNFSGNGW
ncbi:MAG: hypothetical protein ABI579_02305 [Candidatus Sumerlaeota bacterium]